VALECTVSSDHNTFNTSSSPGVCITFIRSWKRCTECGSTNPKTIQTDGQLLHAKAGCGGEVVHEREKCGATLKEIAANSPS